MTNYNMIILGTNNVYDPNTGISYHFVNEDVGRSGHRLEADFFGGAGGARRVIAVGEKAKALFKEFYDQAAPLEVEDE